MKELFYSIIKHYSKIYGIDFTRERTFCYPRLKIIVINVDDFINPNEDIIFDFLHEVGHLKTNTPKMIKCEEEYYATEWAIKEIKKYGIYPTYKRLLEYQLYIYGFMKGRKRCPSVNDMTLNFL